MNLKSVKSVNYHPGKLLRLARKIIWFFSVYILPKHDATVLTRNGLLTFNSKDKTTGRFLHVYRDHEFDEMMLYISMLRKEGFLRNQGEGIVLDVGGYIGMSSTAFLLENCFDKAIAFEPSPESFRLLKQNILNNQLEQRMFVHNLALSDAEGVLEFELSHKNFGDHRIRKSGDNQTGFFDEQNRQVIKVAAKTLDSLSEQEFGTTFDQVKLVWMDVQGHEGKFLKGAQTFLKNHPRVPVIMEFWPYAIKRSGLSRNEFVDLVSSLFDSYYLMDEDGYQAYDIDQIRQLFDKEDHPQKGATVVFANKKPGTVS